MDRRYVSEMAPIFWDNLHRLKLNKGRITINNIMDQIKRDFGITTTRKEILEVLFADEIKQKTMKMKTLRSQPPTSPITKQPQRPKSAPYQRQRPNSKGMKRQVDKRIKTIKYRPVTPVYRASWTADKLIELKNTRAMYRTRSAHYNHVRRIRRPSVKPYPGGGSPKAPAFRI
jgi:hypothetical protein